MPARLDVRDDADREGLLRGEAGFDGGSAGGGELGEGGGRGERGGAAAAVRASISSAPPPGYLEQLSGALGQFLSQNFMSGFAILFPLVVTVYATLWLIRTFDELVSPIYEAAFGFEIFGLGFVTSMAFIFLTGLLGSSWVGKLFILAGEVRGASPPPPSPTPGASLSPSPLPEPPTSPAAPCSRPPKPVPGASRPAPAHRERGGGGNVRRGAFQRSRGPCLASPPPSPPPPLPQTLFRTHAPVCLVQVILLKIPFASSVYSASKQVSVAIHPSSDSAAFREFVVVRHPRKGEYAFGFITGEVSLQDATPEQLRGTRTDAAGHAALCTVYVPTNHVYVGDVFLISPDDIIRTNLPVSEGLEIVVSMGMSCPDVIRARSTPVTSPKVPPAF